MNIHFFWMKVLCGDEYAVMAKRICIYLVSQLICLGKYIFGIAISVGFSKSIFVSNILMNFHCLIDSHRVAAIFLNKIRQKFVSSASYSIVLVSNSNVRVHIIMRECRWPNSFLTPTYLYL